MTGRELDERGLVPVKTRMSFLDKVGFVAASFTRNYILWKRFKISAVIGLVSTVVTIATFFFLKFAIQPNGEYYGEYGNDFFSFILIGMAFFAYANISLEMYRGTISQTYFSNWLEMILSSPLKLFTYLGIVTIWSFISATVSISIYLGIGVYFFNAAISLPSNFLLLPGILILAILAISGLGLISASMFLLFDVKGTLEPVSWFFSTFAGLVAGSVFPPKLFLEVFPPLYYISRILPHTYALDAFRRVMNPSMSAATDLPIVYWDMFLLVLFCIVFLPLGTYLFRLGIQKAEREGKLARWGA